MENAVDALKMGFAVLAFVMALSLAFYMFSEARTTADFVLHKSDISRFVEYEGDATNLSDTEKEMQNHRIVGLETIIPTLYKYYKENYTVIFKNSSNPRDYMEVYTTQTDPKDWSGKDETDKVNKYFGGQSTKICSFDVDEETKRREPWGENPDAVKKNLDAFLSGGTVKFTGMTYTYPGFIEQHTTDKFIENIGEYVYNEETAGTAKKKKKRVIIFTKL